MATMAEAVILPTPGIGKTPAGFIAAVPGSDRLFDLLDPFLQIAELIGHRPHGDPCFRQDARVGIIIDDGDQLGNPPDTQRRHDPELAER